MINKPSILQLDADTLKNKTNMGNIFDRSSANRSGKSKSKPKKKKRQQVQERNTSIVDEKFIGQNNNDLQNSPESSYDKQEEWMARMEQHQLTNVNGIILMHLIDTHRSNLCSICVF